MTQEQPVTRTNTILYKEESYAIQGAIFDVYKEIGCGFLEAVYQECLCKEFSKRKIPFISKPELQIHYKGEALSVFYRPDFICFGKVIIELKAIQTLGDEHRAQMLNYLKASGYRLGLLVNFSGFPKVTIERMVL